MELSITTTDGRSIGEGLAEILTRRIESISDYAAKSKAGEALAQCIKDHWATRFPGSKFYSPNCVTSSGAVVMIDNPGVGRAYHDVDIFPTNAEYLAIPLTDYAKSLSSPTEMDGLFKIKNHDVLARNEGGTLVCHYALSKHVHQSQDSTIMPTEDAMVNSVISVLLEELNKQ